MRKIILLSLLAACLLLSGCSALLERSYSVVEPYADRFWETGVEDTLKAESYQDLVNTLLMLVEERAEEGVIRFYAESGENVYELAREASREVREETMLGSYLLRSLTFTGEPAENYCTLTYQLKYRADAEDPDSIMTLSDSQSLVDLLRLAVREGHGKLTARFTYDMPREEVAAAVETLWQELCLGEEEPASADPAEETDPTGENQSGSGDQAEDVPPADGETTEALGSAAEEPVRLPPCPWEIVFYPDMESAGIVEILLD